MPVRVQIVVLGPKTFAELLILVSSARRNELFKELDGCLLNASANQLAVGSTF